jgi:hypothetical protein
MSDYKEIQGYTVEKLSSDPSPVITGKLYYNDTSNVFKIGAAGDAAWSTTNSLQAIRLNQASAGANAEASMIFAGVINPPAACPTMVTNTETFDGTNWTEVADVNTAGELRFGGGTSTAALGAGGYNCPGIHVTETELWNGVSWTVNPATTTGAPYGRGSNGTQTSILAYGGTGFSNDTEEWNGTSWTEIANMNTGRGSTGGAGANANSAICIAGTTPRPPPPSATVTGASETWNGASWTTVTSCSAKRDSTTMGTSTAALRSGGYPTTYNTEIWNGTAWTESPNSTMNTYSRNHNGGGTQAGSGMMTGGYPGNPSAIGTASEEWSNAPISARTVTTS